MAQKTVVEEKGNLFDFGSDNRDERIQEFITKMGNNQVETEQT